SAGTPDSALTSCVTVKTSAKPAEPTEKPQCKGGMILLDEGACACPAGTAWNGRNCTRPRETTGGGGADGITVPTPCPRDRPIGTFPNCCPVGTVFKDGACRRRDTGNGTKPDEGGGTQGTKKCPAGTHFERTLKHPLGACVSDTGNGGTQGNKPGEDKCTRG